ncbi:RNA polymerase factor sigma-54 [Runella slithyformis]|uniref:RNA polymerase, sigma 54 subunit, RpoN n=1 Tax=Runella slithyformis (strain ATCC 29530 / DSM 19594 / LMG 11500 / NCIMB 11436 / LSU 4) TaxID=761193 RepID=A0A7U3ZRB4_RUNSL|nr:RNA polymerase factor sigma-54 [Runella slithyformis]AEI51878.1 RNA polymerase, sigma 54 subunit, RpoN [Runella slithyformis DSM 19594]
MQKLSLNQTLQQKLSPQQIQFIKLLQIPTAELETRIEEELEINPALEEGMEDDILNKEDSYTNDADDEYDDDFNHREDISLDDYLNHDEYGGYKMYSDGNHPDEDREMPIATISTLQDALVQQFGYLRLNERQTVIGLQLLGSFENDGYIRRSLQAIVNDMAFSQSFYSTVEEVEQVLKKIQTFDPPGIGARNLQECLLLQLNRKDTNDTNVCYAIKIIEDFFEEFSKKHYEKIQKRLGINDEQMKNVISVITKLNPKPGSVEGEDGLAQYLLPDFWVNNNNGKLEVHLNSKNAPELRISRSFADMLDTYDKSDKSNRHIRETVTFVKQKLDAAKWFIDAIKQRQNTLQRTMNAIVNYQYEFFIDGDETRLKPMILKDIANRIEMDVSTVSRVANSKAVQTEFGVYPLKYFFSEGISTDYGEDASSREVKSILKEFIENEPKSNPLSDDKLEKLLNDRGYNIARRTVAKYREQLNIPVARLRKQL